MLKIVIALMVENGKGKDEQDLNFMKASAYVEDSSDAEEYLNPG